MYTDSINDRKNILRKKYMSIRFNQEKNIKDLYDDSIINQLVSSVVYKSCNVILTYVSKPDEVNTRSLILKALSDQKIVGVPRCIKKNNKMNFFKLNSLNDLTMGSFNVMEPIISQCKPIQDFSFALCIVPGFSFDKKGYRLGYGKGYYDRFLSSFEGKSVGLCYEKCICDELPKDEFDQRVDVIVTEKKIIN